MKRYNIPESGTSDWHIPLNENFENLERDVEIRDTESNLDEYEPKDGAKYLAVDTGKVYLGNGENWNTLGTIDEVSGSVDSSSINGITSARTNVGAIAGGTYHSRAYSDGGYGVVFEASNLYIDSVVVDSDLSDVTEPNLTIELRKYQDGADDPQVVDSTTVTLSGGPERVVLGFTVPASGSELADKNDKYVLQRGDDEGIPLRRRFEREGDWSESDFDDQTYAPSIDFIQGTINSASSSVSEPVGSWYYFFDWLVGPEKDRIISPWSTDIEEIYMRPRDPEEEFDNISPRALWIDTS
ncbi:hypothetical protein HUB97_13720 [Halorubraceae archaeon YAN]|nr:hypothetical protein [Halorubraceae archaeon YAN]